MKISSIILFAAYNLFWGDPSTPPLVSVEGEEVAFDYNWKDVNPMELSIRNRGREEFCVIVEPSWVAQSLTLFEFDRHGNPSHLDYEGAFYSPSNFDDAVHCALPGDSVNITSDLRYFYDIEEGDKALLVFDLYIYESGATEMHEMKLIELHSIAKFIEF